MRQNVWAVALLLAGAGCGDDDAKTPGEPGESVQSLTYWQDVAPIFEAHCLQCHRAGGIAPFRLDDPAQARAFAPSIQRATEARTMPPWAVTSDGSCGQFADSLALTDEQIQTIGRWVEGGAQEGAPGAIHLPDVPTLAQAQQLATPVFQPEAQGGELAESDEYRCFDLSAQVEQRGFITGYEVVPGRPAIIHHVLLMLVDADAATEDDPSVTNLARMQALDGQSPERDGWPCLGMAGDGVAVSAVPVTWAPGQGVVRYPNASGVPLTPAQRVIAQVHYNLADATQIGGTDQTIVRLQIEPEVENVGVFLLEDPLLGSLFQGMPTSLPAGQASAPYTWRESAAELGVAGVPGAKLYGIMPHMHQLGHKYQMRISVDGSTHCAADVQDWDFHWQRMYFYAQPWSLSENSQIEVTCDYDTSQVSAPVLPGWGTRNEMCLATLYFTVPVAAYRALGRDG